MGFCHILCRSRLLADAATSEFLLYIVVAARTEPDSSNSSNTDHGSFAPMVGRKLKSLVMRQFVGRFCVGVIHIPSDQLTFVAVRCTFSAVCFGHKMATAVFVLEKMNPCKLLRMKR